MKQSPGGEQWFYPTCFEGWRCGGISRRLNSRTTPYKVLTQICTKIMFLIFFILCKTLMLRVKQKNQ